MSESHITKQNLIKGFEEARDQGSGSRKRKGEIKSSIFPVDFTERRGILL
jgi:hypothetical protein